MGAYLSTPVTEKESEKGEDDVYKYGTCGMQGWRTEMEDAHANVLDLDQSTRTSFFAIFDGHGGQEVAKFAAEYMAPELTQLQSFKGGQMGQALADAFLRMDELLSRQEARAILEQLAGKGGKNKQKMEIDEDQLPFYMKQVLQAARDRAVKGDDDAEDASLIENMLDGPSSEDPAAVCPASAMSEAMSHDGDQEGEHEASSTSSAGTSPEERGAGQAGNFGGQGNGRKEPETGTDSEESGQHENEENEEQHWAGPSAGCTAVAAIVRGNTLTVANAGDSRCVLCRKGKAVAMTEDHKPTTPEEHDRIMKAGGFVAEGRVNGSLNLSRALGDHEYKQNKGLGPEAQIVTACPEVRTQQLQPGDEFLLLACDGIWDVLTNQEAIDLVRERLQKNEEPEAICKAMCDHCMAPDTQGDGKGCDNMSIMVVQLKHFAGTT